MSVPIDVRQVRVNPEYRRPIPWVVRKASYGDESGGMELGNNLWTDGVRRYDMNIELTRIDCTRTET